MKRIIRSGVLFLSFPGMANHRVRAPLVHFCASGPPSERRDDTNTINETEFRSRYRKWIMPDTAACPHCGAEIQANATFCPHCGSSESDGWRDEFESDEDDFDYDQYIAENFSPSIVPTGQKRIWQMIALVLLLLFLLRSLLSFN